MVAHVSREPSEGRIYTSRMRMTVFVPLMVDRKGCALKARESSAPSSAASTAPAHVPRISNSTAVSNILTLNPFR